MEFEYCLTYKESKDFEIKVKNGEFITLLGEGNSKLINNLFFKKENNYITYKYSKISYKNLSNYRNNVIFIINRNLNIFLGETVRDELAYGMENKGFEKEKMLENIKIISEIFKIHDLLDKDPNGLGISDKVKVKIAGALLCEPNILVLDNVLCEIDQCEKENVVEYLKEYVKKGNVILNFTTDINESLYSEFVYIIGLDKILISGKTLNVLNEDKILKKLGIGLPFIVELNKYLIDYSIIDSYILYEEKLVGTLCE